MSDEDRPTGQRRSGIAPGDAARGRAAAISKSWVGGAITAFTLGSLAAVWTALPGSQGSEAAVRPVQPLRLTLALRSPGTEASRKVRAAGPALTLGDEPEAAAEPVAGPLLITDDETPQLSLGGSESPLDRYTSSATVPLARPLPLFRESDAFQVVPPEGLVVTAPVAILPSPTTTPPSSLAPTTAATRSSASPTTTKPKKPRSEKATTTTQAPNLLPLVVPPEGLVIAAPGFVPQPPTAGATAPTPSNPPLTTLPSTTPGRPTGTIPFVPLAPPTVPGAPTTVLAPPPSTAASTVPPATVAPTTTSPTTTIARTTANPVFIPLPTSTAPGVAPLPPAPSTSVATTTAPGRLSVGSFPTIDVRPVTETRTAPPLPIGAETLVPTTPPTSTAPKTYTFMAATGPPPPVHPQAALVVETAKSLLGSPYVWGGEGPGYDCSGLSLVAWRAAGVKLAHQSQAQFASTTRVNLADIAIGDLVFYGEPIHHLGIYIGDGKMIEAPRAGINVRITSIKRRDLIGIGRVSG